METNMETVIHTFEITPLPILERYDEFYDSLKSSVWQEALWQIKHAKRIETDEQEFNIDWNEMCKISISPEKDTFCVQFKLLNGEYEKAQWHHPVGCGVYPEDMAPALEDNNFEHDKAILSGGNTSCA